MELSMLFTSPIAWLILVIFVFLSGMEFTEVFGRYLQTKASGYGLRSLTNGIYTGYSGLFTAMQRQLYLFIPLLTMGIMSREYSNGSIKLLFSSPITNFQIVFGKFCALMLYCLILIGSLFIIVIFCLFSVKSLDFTMILSGMLGLYLLICAYAAIGLFVSSLTSYQVVAAIGTLAILAVLNFIGGVGQDIEWMREITYWLSMNGRSDEFINGLICSEDVVYFIVVIGLFLGITILKLHFEKKHVPFIKMALEYIAVVAVVVFIGYMSARPSLMTFYDATRMKSQTLTPNSQEIMKQLDGGLTITTYVNLLTPHFTYGMPKSVLNDMERFKQYIRFKPEIKMKYVYYYDDPHLAELDNRFPKLDVHGRAKEIARSWRLKLDMFLTPDEIKKQIDLSQEQNRFVRLIERENGQKTFLRIFDDNSVHPFETQISSALKRMVAKVPQVKFLTGHGERSIYKDGEGDYSLITNNVSMRSALINQGFDLDSLSFDRLGTTEPIDVLVLADPQRPLTAEESAKIEQCIASGQDMLIAGKPGNQDILNPILAQLGIQFTPGTIVKPTEHFAPDLMVGRFTPQAMKFSPNFAYYANQGYSVTSVGTMGIVQVADKGFQVMPMIVTDSAGCWLELETKEFFTETPVFNADKGEQYCSNMPIISILAREINNKLQKIVVLGNADCIGNGELLKSRKGISPVNFGFISEMFRWYSNGEFPVNTARAKGPDTDFRLTYSDVSWLKILLMGLFPLIFAVLGARICLKREKH